MVSDMVNLLGGVTMSAALGLVNGFVSAHGVGTSHSGSYRFSKDHRAVLTTLISTCVGAGISRS